VVKGKHPKRELGVLHYRLKKGVWNNNGPLYVKFDLRKENVLDSEKGAVDGPPRTAYMIFLKKRADGYYQCVTGQADAALSVKKLTPVDLEELG
jgi:hypothetical protein